MKVSARNEQVMAHSRRRQPQTAGNLAGIPQLSVQMGQHLPEALHLRRRNPDAQLRQVLFQERPEKGLAPAQLALSLVARKLSG
jgi:hypothetical protein